MRYKQILFVLLNFPYIQEGREVKFLFSYRIMGFKSLLSFQLLYPNKNKVKEIRQREHEFKK